MVVQGCTGLELIALAFEKLGDFNRAHEFATSAAQPCVFDSKLNRLVGNVGSDSIILAEMCLVRILCLRNQHHEAELLLRASKTRVSGFKMPFYAIVGAKQAILSGIPKARFKFDSAQLFAQLKGPPAVVARILAGADTAEMFGGHDAVDHLMSGLERNWKSHP
jgi:hypothetical protein